MREPFLTWLEKTPAIVRRVMPRLWFRLPANDNQVYLTFDDGPHPQFTPALLELLDEFDAGATFFMIGSEARQRPELVKEIASRHGIGNHTWNHLRLHNCDPEILKQQLEPTRHLLQDLAGRTIDIMRPPYGFLGYSLLKYARTNSHPIVMWDVLTWDFLRCRTATQICACLLDKISPGSIVVMHDGHPCAPKMIQALRTSLPILKERGFRFLPLPELAANTIPCDAI